MKTYKVAIIGCGRPSAGTNANKEGFSIAYLHAMAYREHERATIVAAADISAENAQAFADRFQVPNIYTDYKQMIDEEKPDIVSICTWPTLHKEMTVYAAQAGVDIILCEKPMAVGLDEVDAMLEVCERSGSRLFINHQRRYGQPFRIIRQLIDDGVLGQILRLEGWVGDGWDLMSWGTHWVDMHRFFMHDRPVRWVLAQAPHTGNIRYGHPVEDHMLLQFQFDNEVVSFIHLGNHLSGAGLRVVGSEGTISMGDGGKELSLIHNQNGEALLKRYLDMHPPTNDFAGAIEDMIAAAEEGRNSEIDGNIGGVTTEIIMSAYRSSMDGRTITLPLESRSFHLVRDYH